MRPTREDSASAVRRRRLSAAVGAALLALGGAAATIVVAASPAAAATRTVDYRTTGFAVRAVSLVRGQTVAVRNASLTAVTLRVDGAAGGTLAKGATSRSYAFAPGTHTIGAAPVGGLSLSTLTVTVASAAPAPRPTTAPQPAPVPVPVPTAAPRPAGGASTRSTSTTTSMQRGSTAARTTTSRPGARPASGSALPPPQVAGNTGTAAAERVFGGVGTAVPPALSSGRLGPGAAAGVVPSGVPAPAVAPPGGGSGAGGGSGGGTAGAGSDTTDRDLAGARTASGGRDAVTVPAALAVAALAGLVAAQARVLRARRRTTA